MQAINRGPKLFHYAGIADLLHDADDGIPIAIFVELAELEPRTDWRAPGIVEIRKGLVSQHLVADVEVVVRIAAALPGDDAVVGIGVSRPPDSTTLAPHRA
jgi:hypothetical protein